MYLPSYLLNRLKQKSTYSVPVFNVYTDFFVNQLLGLSHIDYHFTPTQEVKQFLCDQGVQEKRIFVTGIPIHPFYMKDDSYLKEKDSNPFTIIISGGSLGTGKKADKKT